MGLLVGQDVDIAHYDAGKVEAHLGGPVDGGDFSLDVAPVDVGAYAQADIKAQLQAGFDTYGIRKAISNGSPGEVFNGLYISTVDSSGKETPNLDLSGQIGLFAKAGIPGASIGVDGGIRLHTSLKIRDVNQDHKFRPSDLGRLSQGAGCVFGATFDSNAFLKITGSLGFGPASVSTDFVDIEQPLWDFNSDCPATAGDSDPSSGGGWLNYQPHTPLGSAVAIGGSAAALNDSGDVLASDGGGDFIRSGTDGTRQDLGALGQPEDLNNAGEALFLQSDGFSTPHLVIREPDGRKVTIPQPNVTGPAFLSQPGPGACNSLVYGESTDGLFIADATSSQLIPDTVPIGFGRVDHIHMLGGNSSGLALAGRARPDTCGRTVNGSTSTACWAIRPEP